MKHAGWIGAAAKLGIVCVIGLLSPAAETVLAAARSEATSVRAPGTGAAWQPPPWTNSDEYLIVPLRIHVLRSQRYRELNCALTEADVTRILGKVNAIWAQAGIQFYLESLRREPANETHAGVGTRHEANEALLACRPHDSLGEGMLHIYYLHRLPGGINGCCLGRDAIFVQEEASLLRVEGGIDEPIPRVTGHEIGHQLLLSHRPERDGLMASGCTGVRLTDAEISRARAAARGLPWILSPPAALAQTTRVERQTGLAILRCLAQIPGDLRIREKALARLKQWETPAADRK
jgi:hypothetical protein